MMHRITSPVGLALGLLVLTTSVAVAAGPTTSFTGTWISTDTDGSTQLLKVAAGQPAAVLYQDFYASVCANDASPAVHFTAIGAGTASGNTLDVSFGRSGCGRSSNGSYESVWSYDAGTDTLGDPYGVTWYRVP